jgi:hypothetical protein
MNRKRPSRIMLLYLFILMASIFQLGLCHSNMTEAVESIVVLRGDGPDIGDSCQTNEDCNLTTNCCSENKCVPGRICYQGQKEYNDTCSYDFECLSRCCINNKTCMHFMDCVSRCNVNSECNTGCCSFGYCSAEDTCLTGKKQKFDFCDADQECSTGICAHNRCSLEKESVPSQSNDALGITVIAAAALITLSLYCCFCKSGNNDQDKRAGRRSVDHSRGGLSLRETLS